MKTDTKTAEAQENATTAPEEMTENTNQNTNIDGFANENQAESTGTTEPQAPLTPEQENEQLVDQLQRLQAEFQNYRKRVERDEKERQAAANDKLLREILPIADSLQLSLQHAKDPEGNVKGEELLTGLVMMGEQFHQFLEHHGLTVIPLDGQFNPRMHEAITVISEEGKQRGQIIQTFQRGYLRGEKVFRPAKVSVAK